MRRLLDWYEKKKRNLPWRHTRDIYAIWISETMLQQTQVNTVIPYYIRFMSVFPDIRSLAKSSEHEVLKLWQGLGYYSRARHLFQAAQLVQSKYCGVIPDQVNEFSKLPGVGPYITAAVLSVSRGLPLPAVDGNVMRVFTRLKALDMDIRNRATRNHISLELKKIITRKNPGIFNQAFMELGAIICTPHHPRCPTCPLAEECRAYYQDQVDVYPLKSEKPVIPVYQVAVAVIVKHGRFYIQKRPSRGHLGGMWEFPGGKVKPDETDEQALLRECREELGIKINIDKKLTTIKHAYTHFKIVLGFFLANMPDGETIHTHTPHEWITVQQIQEYPFPAANHKFFPMLEPYLKANK
jgi:A/G-specific adenine glycosylase